MFQNQLPSEKCVPIVNKKAQSPYNWLTVNTHGNDWTSGGTRIMNVGDTHYSATSGSYGAKTALTTSDAALINIPNTQTKSTFWQLQLNLLNPDFVGTPSQTVTLTGVC